MSAAILPPLNIGGNLSEIDVFSNPHRRMKELVETRLNLNIEDVYTSPSFDSVLENIYCAFWEFKTHEYIENNYIMEQLKTRLAKKHIYNKLVCNCHDDSTLLNIIEMIEQLYSMLEDSRINVELIEQLQAAIKDFILDFLPHMEEEESYFQPLLIKHFKYEELKEIKHIVEEKHQLFKNQLEDAKNTKLVARNHNCLTQYLNELTISVQNRLDHNDEASLSYCKIVAEKENQKFNCNSGAIPESCEASNLELNSTLAISHLPEEIMVIIFSYLSPKDLSRCSKVCKNWNRLAYAKSFWKALHLRNWAHSIWNSDSPLLLEQLLEATLPPPRPACSKTCLGRPAIEVSETFRDDEGCAAAEASQKELRFFSATLKSLLPNVGQFVSKLVVSGSPGLSSYYLNKILLSLPNLQHLDASYTKITHAAFRRPTRRRAGSKLCHVDLGGCGNFCDRGVTRFVRWFGPTPTLSHLNLSGCSSITDDSLTKLSVFKDCVEWLDFSGCYLLTGSSLCKFVSQCQRLCPENLFYCNLITDGPFPLDANGCQNLNCPIRSCCTLSTF